MCYRFAIKYLVVVVNEVKFSKQVDKVPRGVANQVHLSERVGKLLYAAVMNILGQEK